MSCSDDIEGNTTNITMSPLVPPQQKTETALSSNALKYVYKYEKKLSSPTLNELLIIILVWDIDGII
jgi:hypothetical protein